MKITHNPALVGWDLTIVPEMNSNQIRSSDIGIDARRRGSLNIFI